MKNPSKRRNTAAHALEDPEFRQQKIGPKKGAYVRSKYRYDPNDEDIDFAEEYAQNTDEK